MDYVEWYRSECPLDMFQALGPPGKLVSERKYRLIAAACCRETCNRFADLNIDIARYAPLAVEATENYADGKIPLLDLEYAFFPFVRMRNFGDDFFNQIIETGNASAYDAVYQWVSRSGTARAYRYANVLREMCGYPFHNDIHLTDDGTLTELVSDRPIKLNWPSFAKDVRELKYRPVSWLSPTAISIAREIYEDRAFGNLPILADALEEAGCTSERLLRHFRGEEIYYAGVSSYPETGCLSVAPVSHGEGWGVWQSTGGISSNWLHIASHKRAAKKWAESHFDIAGWKDRSDASGKFKRVYAIPGNKAKFGWRASTFPHSRGCWALDAVLRQH